MSTDRLTGRRHAQAEHNDDLLDGAVVGSRLLRLRLLGDFSLRCNDQIIGVSATRIQSLLAYLALHRDAATTRQQLAFMFWPESSEAQARNNLRQVVHQLRRMWPAVDDWMSIEANRLAWRRAVGFDLDVDVFEEALARAGRAERAGDAPCWARHWRGLLKAIAESCCPGATTTGSWPIVSGSPRHSFERSRD